MADVGPRRSFVRVHIRVPRWEVLLGCPARTCRFLQKRSGAGYHCRSERCAWMLVLSAMATFVFIQTCSFLLAQVSPPRSPSQRRWPADLTRGVACSDCHHINGDFELGCRRHPLHGPGYRGGRLPPDCLLAHRRGQVLTLPHVYWVTIQYVASAATYAHVQSNDGMLVSRRPLPQVSSAHHRGKRPDTHGGQPRGPLLLLHQLFR